MSIKVIVCTCECFYSGLCLSYYYYYYLLLLLLYYLFTNNYYLLLLLLLLLLLSGWNAGMFGIPLDVCAQSMYRAITAVVEKVSNLSLREIHLVNINPETTHLIQSVFLQLTSSDGDDDDSPVSENPPAKPPSMVAEPQEPSYGRDEPPPAVEVGDLLPENVQTSKLKTSPDGRNTPDEEVAVDHSRLLDAAEDPQTCLEPQDKKVLDQKQTEGPEPADDQCQCPSTVVPDTEEHFDDDAGTKEQLNLASGEPLTHQDDQKSAESDGQVTEKVWNNEDGDDQSFDVKSKSDQEQKDLQPVVDQEEEELANEVSHAKVVSNTTEKDNQTLENSCGVKDSETGEMAGCEVHERLSSKPGAELETFMQELSLEEYREDATPGSVPHESDPAGSPSDLPEDAS